MMSQFPSPPPSPSSSSSTLSLSSESTPCERSGGLFSTLSPSSSLGVIDPLSACSGSALTSPILNVFAIDRVQQLQQPSPPPDFARLASSRTVRFNIDHHEQQERKLWEHAIDHVINEADGNIDLTNAEITHIPPSIIDVKNLVVIPGPNLSRQSTTAFQRSVSAPAAVFNKSGGRSFTRATTTVGQPTGKYAGLTRAIPPARRPLPQQPSSELQLYLGQNKISKLPRELFQLTGLTVLSLRANQLTSVPPAIANLVNLKELNLVNNKLTFLPAEILQLSLQNVQLHGNNWLKPPPTTNTRSPKRRLSSLVTHFETIPPLTELAMRVLISPPSEALPSAWPPLPKSQPSAISLQVHYRPPFALSNVPEHLLKPLDLALPPQLRTKPHDQLPNSDGATHDPNYNRCCSSLHSRFRFVQHAEERYEWVAEVGGVKLGDPAVVPVLWRGCSRGCLDFLCDGESEKDDLVNEAIVPSFSGLNFTDPDDWDDEFN